MRKRILLWLFLFLNPFIACAMEEEENSFRCCSSLCSYISSWFVVNEAPKVPLSPMQKVRKSKIKFRAQLKDDISEVYDGMFHKDTIKNTPVCFFNYCFAYYRTYRVEDRCMELSDLDQDASLLNACKEARIDGYSALGAAIMFKSNLLSNGVWYVLLTEMDASIEDKFNLTQDLPQKGFTLTEKDKTLLALELYDSIPAEHEQMMVVLLQDQQKGNLAMLSHDVRRYIVEYAVRLYKEKAWFSFLCY